MKMASLEDNICTRMQHRLEGVGWEGGKNLGAVPPSPNQNIPSFCI